MVLVIATIIKCNASLCCNYNIYCNITKKLLPKPIATPLIAMTTNESDFVSIATNMTLLQHYFIIAIYQIFSSAILVYITTPIYGLIYRYVNTGNLQ
jgi:hypothetical protein